MLASAITSANVWINTWVTIGLAGIFALGLQLNAGSSGIINVGQGGFLQVGAYTVAVLVAKSHINFWLAVGCAVVLASVAGLGLGVVALRLRADYFAIASIAFALIISGVVTNLTNVTGGTQGLFGYSDRWAQVSGRFADALKHLGISNKPLLPLLICTWLIFIVALVAIRYLVGTPWGRLLEAMREDEYGAESLGKNTFVLKLQSVGIAAALAGIAGVIFALQINYLNPSEFDGTITFYGYAAVILGGLGSYYGVMAGTVGVYVVLQLATFVPFPLSVTQVSSAQLVAVGVMLVAVCIFRPRGLFGQKSAIASHD